MFSILKCIYQTLPESSTLDFIFLFLFLNFIFMANTWVTNRFSTLWACLLLLFKQRFSVFKQYYTYFYTLFHPHVFSQNNNVTKWVLYIYIHTTLGCPILTLTLNFLSLIFHIYFLVQCTFFDLQDAFSQVTNIQILGSIHSSFFSLSSALNTSHHD